MKDERNTVKKVTRKEKIVGQSKSAGRVEIEEEASESAALPDRLAAFLALGFDFFFLSRSANKSPSPPRDDT